MDFKNYIASNQQISYVRSRVVDRGSVAFTINITPGKQSIYLSSTKRKGGEICKREMLKWEMTSFRPRGNSQWL